jgi:PAS domain S-box-containing protein
MHSERGSKLRQQAEELLKKERSGNSLDIPEENMLKLIHELQVHQIELELQNEELSLAREQEEQAKKKYASLFEDAPSAYFTLTSGGNIVELNLAGEKMLGKERRKLINSRFAFFLSPDTRKNFADFLSKIISGKSTEHCEVAFESSDGIPIYASLSGSLTNEGKMCMIMITAYDITERKLAEDHLLESENQYHNLANAGKALIWTAGKDRLRIYFNESWLKFTGRTLEQELGSGWADGVHPNDIDKCNETYLSAFEKQLPFEMEYRLRHSSGEYRWILDLGTPNFSSAGEFAGYIGHCFDITDRKRNELMMQIKNRIAHSVQVTDTKEHLLEIIRNELGRLLDTTNFFVAMYDVEKDTFSEPIFRDNKNAFSESPVWKALLSHMVKTGEYKPLKDNEIESFAQENKVELRGRTAACWLGTPFYSNKKNAGVMVVQRHDNSEAYTAADLGLIELLAQETGTYIKKPKTLEDLVVAKETAKQSDRLKSAFLANMSHEIRTPMNGILGFAKLLKEPGLNAGKQQEFIQIIEKSGSRLLNIINNIVDISKIEAGMMKLDIKESNIFDQINYIYKFFKPEVEGRGIEFRYSNPLPEGEVVIKTDREKLFAILTNLVKNAIRFTDKGMIEIGYKQKSGALEFFVKDTGIGIPKDRQEAIFDRFVQADIEDRAVRQGSGLGLAISRSYIEMLGGKIWVESEEGIGSTFYFTLPQNTDSLTETAVHQHKFLGKGYCGRKINIMIAEDD